jgi:thiamine-monophosphate kinase
MPRVSAIGEHALVERVRARVGAPPSWVALGIGDDAAVFESERGTLNVVTTDSLIEDVHFRRRWTAARDIGHKALATSLSDLAAMGAWPRAALLSLALPAELSLEDFDAIIDGFASLGQVSGATLVGGNITRSPGPLVVDTTAIGAVKRRSIMRRAGGRAGDELYVTGTLGAAAAGLAMLTDATDRNELSPAASGCLARYERPQPQRRCGVVVGRSRAARACVDLSDGLADGVRQLAAASGTGAIVDAAAIPIDAGATQWAAGTSQDPLEWALSGGEDYELLFAVSPRKRRALLAAVRRCPGVSITRVGRLTTEAGVWLETGHERRPLGSGFSHF